MREANRGPVQPDDARRRGALKRRQRLCPRPLDRTGDELHRGRRQRRGGQQRRSCGRRQPRDARLDKLGQVVGHGREGRARTAASGNERAISSAKKGLPPVACSMRSSIRRGKERPSRDLITSCRAAMLSGPTSTRVTRPCGTARSRSSGTLD